MTLAGRSTRLGFLSALSLLLALAPVASASAQCTVPNCVECVVDPTCTNCRPGYTVGGGGNVCNDINECATNNGGCAPVAGQCTNLQGSRDCTCVPGYTGSGVICNDINECATNNGGCAPVTGQCANLPGTRECTCVSGYAGNGLTCTDINECATSNGGCGTLAAGQCSNTPGSRDCTCNGGYGLTGGTCLDINECADGSNGGCFSSGPFQSACTNLPGSRDCGACPSGFNGNGITCADINECATSNGGCGSPVAAQCSNVPGSRDCTCNSGYADGGAGCADVNECATPNYCNKGTCTNGTGTVTCACQSGFTGPTCDINGYVPPDKTTATCEKAVVDNVAKYVKCITGCRVKKAGAELAGKPFDEQACQADATGGKSCRGAYDKKMASLIAKGTCPACLDQAEQADMADDALDGVMGTKGRAYCDGTVPLAP